MRGCHEKATPPELAGWLARESDDRKPAYPFPGDIRRPVVDALHAAQRGLCVHCGRRLRLDRPGTFHIERFRPRSAFPDLATDFANLFPSCGPETEAGKPSETCGHAKGGRFGENGCVEPRYPACTRRFRFLLTGEAAPASDGNAAAGTTIEMLNLNHRELRKDREDILDRIDGGILDLSDFVDPESGQAQSYAHVVCQRLGAVVP